MGLMPFDAARLFSRTMFGAAVRFRRCGYCGNEVPCDCARVSAANQKFVAKLKTRRAPTFTLLSGLYLLSFFLRPYRSYVARHF